MAKAVKDPKLMSVEDKLRSLYRLQLIDSQIDKIRTIRGELPIQIQDLEDEIAGLDIAEAASELAQEEAAISSSQKLFNRLSNLSLFDTM